ncbi:sulfotransferase [Candidatus Sumerlaeota bacterium]
MDDVTYPLIITGMHRSGTSLLTRLLFRLGLHVGCDCRTELLESRWFREQNMRIFNQASATWYRPGSMPPLLDDPELCATLVAELRAACSAKATRGYLGAERHRTSGSLADQSQPWGWKDPRNTFTLPLWLRVFPQARIITIYRNGVDVASSLRARAQKQARHRRTWRGRLRRLLRLLPKRHFTSLDDTRALRTEMSLDDAFSLWADYVAMNLNTVAALAPTQVCELSYEALLTKPMELLPGVAKFAGLPVDEASLAAAAADIRRDRACAFINDPELLQFYRQHADHPLMLQLGYGNLTAEDPSASSV